MAGIYLHIPFCRKACHYCNFHFSTTLHQKNALLDALLKEIRLSEDKSGPQIDTVYFGGGTPSMLEAGELFGLLDAVRRHFPIAAEAEYTLEANPDDINPKNLLSWKSMGINRLSLGIQSFRNEDLRWMNRSHDAAQAWRSLDQIAEAGFTNFSADLIFGTPGLGDDAWLEQVAELTRRQVPHISAYALTVEPRTALESMVRQGKKENPEPGTQARQFILLMEALETAGYEHYEISNFALPGMRSRHNSAYWAGIPYHGFGPSAHAYDGRTRRWNVSNNAEYIRALGDDRIPFESEILSEDQHFNEYLMTRLRTIEGINLYHVRERWGSNWADALEAGAAAQLASGHAFIRENHLVLTREGKLFADGIAAGLFR